MKIALMGRGCFGKLVYDRLIKDGHEIVGVCTPQAKICTGQVGENLLYEVAQKQVVPMSVIPSLKADLGVMAFVSERVPEEILYSPRLGTIQYHPSLLPKHRGQDSVFWTLFNGDKEAGITVFWPNKGMDTGPVLLQKKVAVAPNDSIGTLYYGKMFPVGIEAMSEAVQLVAEGKAPKMAQDESAVTWEPPVEKIMKIRAARPTDLPEMVTLTNKKLAHPVFSSRNLTLRRLAGWAAFSISCYKPFSEVLFRINPGWSMNTLIAEVNGRIGGFITLHGYGARDRHLLLVIVGKKFGGVGIADRLLEGAVEMARKDGAEKLVAVEWAEDVAINNLLHRHGFSTVINKLGLKLK